MYFFSGLGEERRTPRATSRLLDHGSTWYLRGRHFTHWPYPTRSGLAVGWFYVETEGLSSRELFFISVLTIFNVKAQVPPRAAAWTNNTSKTNIFFSRFPHSGGTRVSSADFFFEIVWKENFATSRFHCYRSQCLRFLNVDYGEYLFLFPRFGQLQFAKTISKYT